jgi:predicted esterase
MSAIAAEETLARGQVVDHVACRVTPAQTYALYLPSSYSSNKRWPVLYCFDPVARGALPVQLYREAAEKYGWIVVGSNNSRNGSIDQSVAAAKAIWEDTHERFQIDDRSVYMTGFSGGSRVALAFAYLCDNHCVSGVIANGAGFMPNILSKLDSPNAKPSFAIFGLAGIEDFNFAEMRTLDDLLEHLSVSHHFETFPGAHEWATKEALMDAVGWMELQAIKAGRKQRDDALIESLWQTQVARARRSEAAGDLYEAYRLDVALASDFNGLRDVTDFRQKAAQLKESEAVKRALKAALDEIKRQREMVTRLTTASNQNDDQESRGDALASFHLSIAKLRKAAGEAQDSSDRRVARRTLNGVFAFYFERGQTLIQNTKNYRAAAASLEIAAAIKQDQPGPFYVLATAYALAGDRKRALEALKKAVEKGFNVPGTIEGDHAFDSLRKEAEYLKIIERLKQQR